MRRKGDLPDELRRSVFGQYVPAYRALAMLGAARGDAPAVFEIAEQIKGRTLLERISPRSARRAMLLDHGQLDQVRGLEGRIATLDARIPLEVQPVARNALTVERDDLLRQWRLFDHDLQRASPAYARANEMRQIAFEEAAGHLTEDETFLSLVVHGDRVVAVWVNATSGGCLDLGRLPALQETVAALRALLSEPDGLPGLAVAISAAASSIPAGPSRLSGEWRMVRNLTTVNGAPR